MKFKSLRISGRFVRTISSLIGDIQRSMLCGKPTQCPAAITIFELTVQATSTNIQEVSLTVKDEIVNAVVHLVALIKGISQGIDLYSRFLRQWVTCRNE